MLFVAGRDGDDGFIPHLCDIILLRFLWNKLIAQGSGCGAVGRLVASNTKDPQFESGHRQYNLLSTVIMNCITKTKIKKKRLGSGNGSFFKKLIAQWIRLCLPCAALGSHPKYNIFIGS